MALNEHADKSEEEVRNRRACYKKNWGLREREEKMHELTGKQIPSSVDWRVKGAVSPLKDQGDCGSCWS